MEKWTENSSRSLREEEIKMDNKQMKWCLVLLVIRKKSQLKPQWDSISYPPD